MVKNISELIEFFKSRNSDVLCYVIVKDNVITEEPLTTFYPGSSGASLKWCCANCGKIETSKIKTIMSKHTHSVLLCNACGKKDTLRLKQTGEYTPPEKIEQHRYTLEEVRQIVEDDGNVLLNESFNTVGDRVLIKCGECGEVFEDVFKQYKRRAGKSCEQCRGPSRIIPLDKKKKAFEKKGMVLIADKYIDQYTPMKIICSCGDHAMLSWKQFIRGVKCDKCVYEKRCTTNENAYGHAEYFKTEDFEAKRKATLLKNTGFDHNMKDKKCVEKSRETNKKNHNGVHNLTLASMRQLAKDGFFRVYGAGHGLVESIREKMRATCRKNWGVDTPLESKEIQKLIGDNNFEKYGNRNFIISEAGQKLMIDKYGKPFAMQVASIFSKMIRTSFKRKEFVFPSGRAEYVLGYEHFALRDLLDEGVEENDIIVDPGEMPCIEYTFEGKTHRYYPDIYIKSTNTFIEIKSEYTLAVEYEKNMEKMKATTFFGDIELRVYNKKGIQLSFTKYDCIKDTSFKFTDIEDVSDSSDDDDECDSDNPVRSDSDIKDKGKEKIYEDDSLSQRTIGVPSGSGNQIGTPSGSDNQIIESPSGSGAPCENVENIPFTIIDHLHQGNVRVKCSENGHIFVCKANKISCPHCELINTKKKVTVDFKKKNLTVLNIDDYEKYETPLQCRCDKCGEEYETTYSKISCRVSSNCKNCTPDEEKFSMIRAYFEKNNCALYSTEKDYETNLTPLLYKCFCGNEEAKTCWKNFSNGTRCCRRCTMNNNQTKRKSSGPKETPSSVQDILKLKYVELIDHYINDKTHANFRCLICGNMENSTTANIKTRKYGCKICKKL
jgi:hypothetical protein